MIHQAGKLGPERTQRKLPRLLDRVQELSALPLVHLRREEAEVPLGTVMWKYLDPRPKVEAIFGAAGVVRRLEESPEGRADLLYQPVTFLSRRVPSALQQASLPSSRKAPFLAGPGQAGVVHL